MHFGGIDSKTVIHNFSERICCSATKSCLTLCNPMKCNTPGFPVLHCLLEFAQIKSTESVILSSHLILCHPLLLLPSIFPSIRVFSNESALFIRWPKYRSFSFSPSNEYSGFLSFWIGWFDLLAVWVFSSTTDWKYQFFGTQPSLWSSSHICTCGHWKNHIWLVGPLLAKWYLCFLICYLILSQLFFQGVSVF